MRSSFIIERLARKQDKTSWQSPVSSFWTVTDYKPLSFSFKTEGICFLKDGKTSTLVEYLYKRYWQSSPFHPGRSVLHFVCLHLLLLVEHSGYSWVSLSTNIRRNCAPPSNRRALLSILGSSAFTTMTASWPPSKEPQIFLVVVTKAT